LVNKPERPDRLARLAVRAAVERRLDSLAIAAMRQCRGRGRVDMAPLQQRRQQVAHAHFLYTDGN
jgi:hypothetical protein